MAYCRLQQRDVIIRLALSRCLEEDRILPSGSAQCKDVGAIEPSALPADTSVYRSLRLDLVACRLFL